MGTWSYSYDTLNRVSTGSQTSAGSQSLSSLPNLCWNYDAFGNRVQQYASSLAFQSGSGGPGTCQPQSNATVATALATFNTSNQMTSTNARGVTAQVTYDASGNVTYDGANYYLYDAEGRICAVSSTVTGASSMTGYMYDADGARVSKGSIQQWSCNPTTAQYAPQTDYILGPGGEQMSEYALQPNNTLAWVHTNVWAAGRLLATYAQDSSSTAQQGLLHFYFDDPLGTRRAQTDYAGNLEQTCGSLPYGDGETCAPTPTEHLFTNKERDSESGNDYFGARYYASTMGRFLSPDWSAQVEPVPYSKLDDPQTLNLYSYVYNNPLSHTDPTGHCGEGSNGWICSSNPICWCSGPQQSGSGFQGFGGGQTGKGFDGGGAGGTWDDARSPARASTLSRVNRLGYGGSVTVAAGPAAVIETTSIVLSSFIPEAAPDAAEAASTALVPLSGASVPYGTISSMAGYDIGGSSGLVGSTYNYNIWGMYGTSESEGMFALVNEMKTTAALAGADSISILGTHVVNGELLNAARMAPMAARVGLTFESVGDAAILLTGLIP